MKVLAVDDSALIRKLVASAASIVGMETLEAENGQEALEVVDKNPDLDIIVLDWNMPEMDGLQMLKKLREDQRFLQVPVLMLTTEGEAKKVVEAVSAGATNYLIKPFTQDELATKIMECLGKGLDA